MARLFGEHLKFLAQFRQQFLTTGAIAPSSRYLAAALTRPLRRRPNQAVRVLEVGPGTGAVTRRIVRLLQPGDRLDLVELNEEFVSYLQQRFAVEPEFQRVAAQTQIHACPIQQFPADQPYDYIISGLPFNNFPPQLTGEIFEIFFRLLAPHGVLSYFEYMYVRSVRRMVSKGQERLRLKGLDQVLQPYLQRHRFDRNWVFANLPPAWVQHLRHVEPGGSATPSPAQ